MLTLLPVARRTTRNYPHIWKALPLLRSVNPKRAATAVVATLALGVVGLACSTQSAVAAEIADDISVTGEESTNLGSSVSQARCDVNGNGIPDLGVGMYATFNMGAGFTGGYVVLDAPSTAVAGDIESLDPVRIIDTAKSKLGGVDIRCAGDVNRDGFDDLIVVSQGYAAYLVFGSADFSTVDLDNLGGRGKTVLGSVTRGMGVGDIDGDGFDEVGVTDTTGRVTILNAEDLPDSTDLASTTGPRIWGDRIDLVSVVAAGDVNGDGRADLYVGAASWTAPGAERFATGSGWILTDVAGTIEVGNVDVPGFRIEGPSRGYDLLGGSAVGIGDINGDGFDDIMLGGDSDSPLSGSAAIVLGSDSRDTVKTNPLATTGRAVSSTSSDGTTLNRGWWVNGVAADDHFGHAVGAVRMNDWSLLLAGAMDGAPNPDNTGSGYVVALDSRALVAGELPVSETGVINSADFVDRDYEGANLIAGTGTDQHLGRAFADLTVDPASTTVTFAAGAPALFNWDGVLPSVRIVTLTVAESTTPPTVVPTTPATVDPSNGEASPAGAAELARTGLGDAWLGFVPMAALVAILVGVGVAVVPRGGTPDESK